MKLSFFPTLFAALAISISTNPSPLAAESSAEKRQKSMNVLKSDAPPAEKAIACKQLAIYGDKNAVPLLAPLLTDTNLASWARIALEAIPGDEANEALRSAIPQLEGRLLIGVINSVGVRRDTQAIETLSSKLHHADAEVVAAAAVALGKIGNAPTAAILNRALASSKSDTRAAVAEGAILCAERLMADGELAGATRLYDAVRKADVPKPRRLEATRGAILARGTDGVALLMEQLRSPDKATLSIALRTARELPGGEVADALGAELDRSTPERQVLLALALADRNDSSVLPKLLQVAQKASKPARVTSLGLLDRFGDLSAVPVLLGAVAENDSAIAQAAKATLTRMEGKAVDSALLARLPESSGKTRQAIIELAALRRIDSALPAILACVEDSDREVRRAALATVGTLGSHDQAADLIRVIAKSKTPDDREEVEKALVAICGRSGGRAVPAVLPLARSNDAELRKVALRALASAGGADAVSVVKAALEDKEESVQDEAVATLATWPNNWPEDTAVAEPLLALAKSGKKTSHQVQGSRGYLLYVQQNSKLSAADKLKAVDALLPSLRRPQEKRLAIATLGAIPSAGAIQRLQEMAADAALAEEACLGIVTVAAGERAGQIDKEVRRKALQTVLEKSKDAGTRNKAVEALRKLEPRS